MPGQMSWLPRLGSGETKMLHLRLEPHHPWMPYTLMPTVAVPDYKVPQGSKGWATYQKLQKEGWTIVPTHEARKIVFASLNH